MLGTVEKFLRYITRYKPVGRENGIRMCLYCQHWDFHHQSTHQIHKCYAKCAKLYNVNGNVETYIQGCNCGLDLYKPNRYPKVRMAIRRFLCLER